MHISDILQKLPASLEWLVLFKLQPLRALTADATIKAMFFLPDETDLATYSHVILTSQGRFLSPQTAPHLILAEGQLTPSRLAATPNSLANHYRRQLQLFPVDEADCLGLGQMADFPPVLLFVQIKSGCAEAKALFRQAPNQRHYELLPAVGVEFKGGSFQHGYYLAEFTNRLPAHIHAGLLAHFSRTSHCNQFFLQHGQIDPQLATGLALAAKDRVTWAKNCSIEALAQLGQQACREPLALSCQPPPPAPAYPFGDLVPLGFLLKALRPHLTQAACLEAGQAVENLLLSRRQGQLWAFQTNRLVTATDSALILQGFAGVDPDDPAFSKGDFAATVAALELFADGQGSYYPQLSTDQLSLPLNVERLNVKRLNVKRLNVQRLNVERLNVERMQADPANYHWRQPDYATTCLVRGLRQTAGLPLKTSLDYLAAGFDTRSGLFFANPYLVDYALAGASQGDEAAVHLREQLLAEILASMNDDYTFGRYDVALSTALAILCMAALGYRGRTMRLAQLHLLDFMGAAGLWPVSTPFYSTFMFDHTRLPAQGLFALLLNNQAQQIIQVQGEYHAVSLYRDTHQMITTALAGLALAEKCTSASRDPRIKLPTGAGRHPRYDCANHSDYIRQFALPPYLSRKKDF